MTTEVKVRNHSSHSGPFFGSVWVMGWLFTIGFLKLAFWKGALALIVWPYYLGVHFHK